MITHKHSLPERTTKPRENNKKKVRKNLSWAKFNSFLFAYLVSAYRLHLLLSYFLCQYQASAGPHIIYILYVYIQKWSQPETMAYCLLQTNQRNVLTLRSSSNQSIDFTHQYLRPRYFKPCPSHSAPVNRRSPKVRYQAKRVGDDRGSERRWHKPGCI